MSSSVKPVPTLSDSKEALVALLSDGPRGSRELVAELASRGFTAKTVRRARERLGVRIDREGFGLATRTIWRLPLVPAESHLGVDVRAAAHSPSVDLRNPEASAAQQSPVSPTPAELARQVGRIEVFQRRGIQPAEAHEIALRLLLADREGRHGLGSCVQCQAWRLGDCHLEPKPALDMHVCWFRRTETP